MLGLFSVQYLTALPLTTIEGYYTQYNGVRDVTWNFVKKKVSNLPTQTKSFYKGDLKHRFFFSGLRLRKF